MTSRTGVTPSGHRTGRASRPESEEQREQIRAQVIESRRRQGLPDTIQDPVFLSRLAEILLADPVDLPTPDSNGEVPPTPLPGEPEMPE